MFGSKSATAETPDLSEYQDEFKLTAHDRCDRCGAQAYTRWVGKNGTGELLFCSHHSVKFEGKGELAKKFELVNDERASLTQARESSAAA